MDKKTLRSKIASLPDGIKVWLGSEDVAALVKAINAHFNILSENRRVIPTLLLRLAVNDLDAEYFSGELAAELQIDKDKAMTITSEIKKSIFLPIKKNLIDDGVDFAAFDKFESPPLIKAGPKILSEINAPKVMSQTATGAAVVGSVPLGTNQTKIAPPPMAPKKLSEVGWSRSTPEGPVVKLSQASPSMPQPAFGTQRVAPPSQPRPMPSEVKGSVGEFERIAMRQSGQISKPATSSEPAPMMLHEDTVFKPASNVPNFRLQQPTEGFGLQKNTVLPPMKPAVLDFAKAPQPAPQNPASSSPRVVHYSEYNAVPPAPKMPQVPQVPPGPRQISEVTYKNYTAGPGTPAAAPPPLPPKK